MAKKATRRVRKSSVRTRLRAAAKKIRKSRKQRLEDSRKNLFRTKAQATEAYIRERDERAKWQGNYTEAVEALPKPFYWRCADGRTLRPSEMDEGHLRNTISYVQRRLTHQFGTAIWMERTAYHVQALHEMLKEANRRGIRV